MIQPILFSGTKELWNLSQTETTPLARLVVRIVMLIPVILCALYETVKIPFDLLFKKKIVPEQEITSTKKIVLCTLVGIVFASALGMVVYFGIKEGQEIRSFFGTFLHRSSPGQCLAPHDEYARYVQSRDIVRRQMHVIDRKHHPAALASSLESPLVTYWTEHKKQCPSLDMYVERMGADFDVLTLKKLYGDQRDLSIGETRSFYHSFLKIIPKVASYFRSPQQGAESAVMVRHAARVYTRERGGKFLQVCAQIRDVFTCGHFSGPTLAQLKKKYPEPKALLEASQRTSRTFNQIASSGVSYVWGGVKHLAGQVTSLLQRGYHYGKESMKSLSWESCRKTFVWQKVTSLVSFFTPKSS